MNIKNKTSISILLTVTCLAFLCLFTQIFSYGNKYCPLSAFASEQTPQARINEIDYDDVSIALTYLESGDTIYIYVDYDQDFTIPQNVIFHGGTSEFSGKVINNGTIMSGEFTKSSAGATDEENDFGDFDDLLNDTQGYGVENAGIIQDGLFMGKMKNTGTINNGEFRNSVDNTNGTINDGLFYGTVKNFGLFNGGTVVNAFENIKTVNGGTFSSITNDQIGVINGGVIQNGITNAGTINNLNEGDIVLQNWFSVVNTGTINCAWHIRTNASNEYVCECRLCGEISHYDSTVDKYIAPTCTKTGLTEGSHCSACDEVFVVQEVIPALGLDVSEKHHTDLNNNRVCDDCGYQYKMSTLAILGIIFGSIIVVGCISFLVCWLTMRKMLSNFALSLKSQNIENKFNK